MDNMPHMSKKNKVKDTRRYRTEKLSPVLSEMQTGNPYKRTTNEYISYQRARRTDAEPITRRIDNAVIGFCVLLMATDKGQN